LTLLSVIAIIAGLGSTVYDLPPVTDSADIIVVMMKDGLLPEEPWEGMTSYQREEFWTLACSGMMIQRAGWAGYLIICPLGTGQQLLETATVLASAEGMPDNSALSRGLELVPVSDCSSAVIIFSREGSGQFPAELPLRASAWLEDEPDTLMIQSPVEGNAFFWTGHPGEVDLSPAAWRGTGEELVPSGEASVKLSFTCVHGSVPSNLLGIAVEPHPLDRQYMSTWGSGFAAVDSLISAIYPVRPDSDHLLWIRGDDVGRPWRTAPSPLPPPSASYSVTMPSEPEGEYPLRDFNASSIPNAVSISLPGRLDRLSMAPVLEAVLERVIGRDLHSDTGENLHFDVEVGTSGEVSIWLIGDQGDVPGDDCVSQLDDILRNSLLVPPGSTLIGNAVTRASYLEGEPVDSVGVREVSMELMNILYPEQ